MSARFLIEVAVCEVAELLESMYCCGKVAESM
jgi:hypothetical protein